MATEQTSNTTERHEPRGFGEHSRGLSGEYAHEQGWGLNEAERTRPNPVVQDTDGGTDYEYGARDFGDEPVNTGIDHTGDTLTQNSATKQGSNEGKENA